MTSLKSLSEILFNEQNCIQYLLEKNIIKRVERCSKCNIETRFYQRYFICRDRTCQKSISVFDQTFFSKSNIKCCDVLLIGYLWINKLKYQRIKDMTDHVENTLVKYIYTFRRLAVNSLSGNDFILGGDHVIVEIDESKFKDLWVLGMIERSTKKCFFKVVNDREKETLTRIIKEHVRKGSTIYTDSWRGYQDLEHHGYRHLKVVHARASRRLQIMRIHTNHIERTWRTLKAFIPMEKRCLPIINEYLHEFIWRRKQRNNLWDEFLNLLRTQ